jgi:hypothetical protein
MWRDGHSVHSWWEGQSLQPQWKTLQRLLTKLKLKITEDPAFGHWAADSTGDGIFILKDTWASEFYAAQFTSTNPDAFSGWMDEEHMAHLHAETHPAMKKSDILLCSTMDGLQRARHRKTHSTCSHSLKKTKKSSCRSMGQRVGVRDGGGGRKKLRRAW